MNREQDVLASMVLLHSTQRISNELTEDLLTALQNAGLPSDKMVFAVTVLGTSITPKLLCGLLKQGLESVSADNIRKLRGPFYTARLGNGNQVVIECLNYRYTNGHLIIGLLAEPYRILAGGQTTMCGHSL